MTTSEIKVLGPKRDLVPEWLDPETGEWHPEHFVQVILAEALGSDGDVHMHTLTTGEAVLDYPEFVEALKRSAATALEEHMRAKGVWAQ